MSVVEHAYRGTHSVCLRFKRDKPAEKQPTQRCKICERKLARETKR